MQHASRRSYSKEQLSVERRWSLVKPTCWETDRQCYVVHKCTAQCLRCEELAIVGGVWLVCIANGGGVGKEVLGCR